MLGWLRRRKDPVPVTKLLFATDLHGSTACLRKVVAAAKRHEVDYVILGGDLTGKAMVPVIREGNGRYHAYLFGSRHEAETKEGLAKLTDLIASVGHYSHVCNAAEARELESDPARLDAVFAEKMRERLIAWLEYLEAGLAPAGIGCYIIAGNDDVRELDTILNASPFVVNVDGKVVPLGDHHELVGLGDSVITPWACPRDVDEDTLARRIDKLMAEVQCPERAVLNFHCPPYNTKLDQVPKLNERLEIEHEGGQVVMTSAGSKAVREAIERYQPVLSLHGHVHEGRGVHRLGRTVAINPGSEYAEGILRSALINLEPDRVKGYLLLSG